MALFGTVSPSNTLGFKNLVVNGAFDFWQRGTSGSTAASFVADRWIINSNSTTHARSTDVPTGFRYSLLMTATSASNAQATTKIESLNCNGLVGEPITLSFWAKSTSGSTQLGTYITHCNSDNDFGSTTSIGSTAFFTLTSTWTRYSVTFTSSAPAGILNGIQLGLFRSGTESSTTFITGVQLEDSSTATPFEFKPYGMELALCQRYYQHLVPTWGTPRPNGYYIHSTAHFKVTMRTSPSLTLAVNSYGQTIGIQDSNADYYVTGAQGSADSSLGAKYNASAEL
jgi:hypothetical protein